eukprot:CAMPEP_0185748900 /NCGR_PEP_ID=MMETSP1174-20130828/7628_1 /TAXON_ID=35687 /ORGANISM="Dictyocha speculum, Strain CCMP1381" /LENGTH=221 /DNA_ID=CAMNT_0028424793 /DNA_START=1 /DNA_END=666 /DNA_ORIENTATION=+
MSVCGSMMSSDCNAAPSDCNASAVQFSSWQGHMTNTTLPVLQDTITSDIWGDMGAGHDYVFIFDHWGHLHTACPGINCESQNSTDLSTPEGRAFIKQKLVSAGTSGDLCGHRGAVERIAGRSFWSSGGIGGTIIAFVVLFSCCGTGILLGLRLWRYAKNGGGWRDREAKEATWAEEHLSCFTELPLRSEGTKTASGARDADDDRGLLGRPSLDDTGDSTLV